MVYCWDEIHSTWHDRLSAKPLPDFLRKTLADHRRYQRSTDSLNGLEPPLA